ncbi:MAG: glycerophosphodiester phosphodiesterase family protein [Alphaproteobacteria bacterium]
MTEHPWVTRRPVAHRGLHAYEAGRVENTLPAIHAAIKRGFAVEIDVRLSGDGRTVVFHDPTLERLMTAAGRVDQMDIAILQQLDFKKGDARIPTLHAVLDLIAGQVGLFIELKTDYGGSGTLERAVADVLVDYDGEVAVMSYDHWAIAGFRQMAPSVARGLVSRRYQGAQFAALPAWRRFAYRHLLSALPALPHFIAYDVNSLPASAANLLRHAINVPLLAWAVRTEEERAIAAAWADQIIFEEFDPSVECQAGSGDR